MKISIITVLNTVNYGSVLQTFATQKFLENLGFEVEFIDYRRDDQLIKNQVKNELFKKSENFTKLIKKPLKCFFDIIAVYKGNKVFRDFVEKNIHLTEREYSSNEDLKKNIPPADIYCTGSDQMWNSDWNQGIERSFFLDFAPENKKRIAFSTSIGKTNIDKAEANEIIPLIKKYDFITMREQSAVDLLAKYRIKSSLVLDPTLMFDKAFWEQYMPERKVKEPYLLVNRLHYDHENVDFNKAVKEIAEKKGLRIVRVAYSYSDLNFGHKIYLPNIFEFLSLVYYADFVVTDSFHTTAFSINLNKQFTVIYPENFGTRLDNVLKLVNLENRKYVDNEEFEKSLNVIDYSYVNDILRKKRNESEFVLNTVIKRCLEY